MQAFCLRISTVFKDATGPVNKLIVHIMEIFPVQLMMSPHQLLQSLLWYNEKQYNRQSAKVNLSIITQTMYSTSHMLTILNYIYCLCELGLWGVYFSTPICGHWMEHELCHHDDSYVSMSLESIVVVSIQCCILYHNDFLQYRAS